MTTSVFARYADQAWPYRFAGSLHITTIAGGTPSDPNVAEGWLRSKLADKDDLIREQVAKVMVARGITADEAAKEVDIRKHLNGFRRDGEGLYIEGRQLKAALKEAASVAVASGKLAGRGWGKTNKGLLSYLAEHVVVVEDRLHLGVAEVTGIQYEEYVEDAHIDFTVLTDHAFTDEEWALIWLTGEQQGIGASRSQGFGRYAVTRWEPQPAAA
ncbi:hypothetical protein AB0I72_19745 [Nocardiopsis sp. NPDC049922]|uniref:hypothetical protein n=1 Tax=Nocardiopsis sp. NPDC049922 TaxID=3155157 RepID=UPI0033C716DE